MSKDNKLLNFNSEKINEIISANLKTIISIIPLPQWLITSDNIDKIKEKTIKLINENFSQLKKFSSFIIDSKNKIISDNFFSFYEELINRIGVIGAFIITLGTVSIKLY